jgi:cytochrome c biogenesis protein
VIVKPNGDRSATWAFTPEFQKQVEGAPVMKAKLLPEGAPKFTLTDFEKASQAHMLSIQYDPGVTIFYIGSALLCLTLILTFFFAHQRLWIVVEDGRAYLGGESNRNRLGFEDRMRRIAARIRGEAPQAEE